MPVQINASGVGAWKQGETVSDEEWAQYPWREKAIRNGAAVEVSESESRAIADPAKQQERLADIDAQIAQLQAERAQLVGTPQEPNAPAAVATRIDRADQPTAQEADQVRKEGREVIQPTATDVNVGEVVPAKDADTAREGSTAGSNAAPPADKPADGRRE